MRRFLLGFIFGLIVAVAAIWYYGNQHRVTTGDVENKVESTAQDVKQETREKLDSWGLSSDNIKAELARTGKVIRTKAQNAGDVIAADAADARITTTIKAKIVADPDLSALSISVSTTGSQVTLSGTASSPENIRKAILLAMDTDGVQSVVSTLQVKR